MKNIHVLQTDKPSRLAYDFYEKFYLLSEDTQFFEFQNLVQNRELYITNDEEIKEGDLVLDKFKQKWKLEKQKLIAFDSQGIKRFSTDNIVGHECKKIILTTDQDLIKNSIQPIPDEFLEWFVKNPSCEEVEIERWFDTSHIDLGVGKVYHNNPNMPLYKIIIPKEGPKQHVELINDNIEEFDKAIELFKQETLEEAAYQARRDYQNEVSKDGMNDCIMFDAMRIQKGFKLGAKWQQKKSYSEEEVIGYLIDRERDLNLYDMANDYEDTFKWFEQFKKK